MALAIVLAALSGASGGVAVAEVASRSIAGRAARASRRRGGSLAGSVAAAFGPVFARSKFVRRLAKSASLRSRIVAAGAPGGLGVREWISIKASCSVAMFVAMAPLALSAPGRLAIVPLTTGPIAGFLLPDFWLGRAARTRAESALRDLPDMLDLLGVVIAAGMPPPRALAGVAARFDSVLAGECKRASAAIALGEPGDIALGRIAERLPNPGVQGFVEAMRSAGRHGRPLVDVLATLARGARHASEQRVRERAARAGPKIQLIVALVLVPSVMLVIAAGLVSELGSSSLVR